MKNEQGVRERLTCKVCNGQIFRDVEFVDLELGTIEAICDKCGSRDFEFRGI